MVWGCSTTSTVEPSTSASSSSSKMPAGDHHTEHHQEWRPQMRGGQMRPGFFPYPPPRRGIHMRPGFFPGPRPFVMPHQNFMNQRKMRPWVHRPPRPPPPPPPPHGFPPPPPETFMPPFPPQPPWTAAPPPPPPPPPPPEAQSEADATTEGGKKKKKRVVNGNTKPWDKEAAERAHALELECQRSANAKSIVIRFPDPDLSKEIVQAFHSSIDNVHFQGPCGARYCFVTLRDEADVDKVIDQLNQIPFGIGVLHAEKKVQKPEENATSENIDPFTLYVGNLALNITVSEVKERFPTASRIDVGHAKRMKNTRYAFVKFSTADAALEAYKASVNTIMASRSIIVRFRRHKAPVGPPGEKPVISPEAKPGEKLTVGAKLKAKKEKAKAEKAAKELESDVEFVEHKPHASRVLESIIIKDEEESEEEVEMENDDDSLSEYDMEDLDADDDDDDDDIGNIARESETDEEYEMSGDDEEDDVDDDDAELLSGVKDEDDDDYFDDDDDCKDVFSLTFKN